jgi:hypothetical protein
MATRPRRIFLDANKRYDPGAIRRVLRLRSPASYLSSLGDERRITIKGNVGCESPGEVGRAAANHVSKRTSGLPGTASADRNAYVEARQLRARQFSFVQGRCFLYSRCTGAPFDRPIGRLILGR